ncbi:MAG: hypothetical protein ACR2QF_07500 [Geminicoccaceae bacterium]
MRRRHLLVTGLALMTGSILMAAPGLRAETTAFKMRDLYEKDLSFSKLAQEFDGKAIEIQGFMAPPLKAESQFFVLTKKPMSVCPFCETEADWPDDIVVVYTEDVVDVVPFNLPIAVHGKLSLGTYRDEEIGFVSRVRLIDASYARL